MKTQCLERLSEDPLLPLSAGLAVFLYSHLEKVRNVINSIWFLYFQELNGYRWQARADQRAKSRTASRGEIQGQGGFSIRCIRYISRGCLRVFANILNINVHIRCSLCFVSLLRGNMYVYSVLKSILPEQSVSQARVLLQKYILAAHR